MPGRTRAKTRQSAFHLLYGQDKVPADEHQPSRNRSCWVVDPLLLANTQPAKLIQPSEGSFHNPAPSAQSVAMLSVSLGEHRHNGAGHAALV